MIGHRSENVLVYVVLVFHFLAAWGLRDVLLVDPFWVGAGGALSGVLIGRLLRRAFAARRFQADQLDQRRAYEARWSREASFYLVGLCSVCGEPFPKGSMNRSPRPCPRCLPPVA